ncbi:MAG: glycoside hydrolase family 13 protein [Blautia sp.]|uniref:glycoside hydrolase family 13 protein n=1 Tax=Blautia sp. TaxID=1955243 RepID=UPI003992A1BF
MEKKWWKESVVYQIYPKSFKDSNGDGIGDIKGIIEKLDYLKELGVNVLWISPMLESPQDDNGYDISDYRRIYEDYGTMEDYEEMLSEAHKRDIKVLMDLVVNHTSDEHNWFIESRKSKDNPYRDYYIWKDPVNGKEPNNWGGVFGGSAWEYDEKTQMYYLHLFSKKQPDLNWENEKVRREVYDMMTFWCEKGIDGFRMDVISMVSKNQAFPDGEVKNGLYGDFNPYCVHGPRIHEFLQEMNKEVLSRYDIMTVGETSGVTIEEAQKYAGEDRNELNMVFQFEHVEDACGDHGKWTTAKFNFRDFKKTMIKWQEELQGKAWNSLFLGNHDQPRSVSRFGNDNPAYRETSAKMLATCLHMMQGTPYVYQGEELGMTNAYFDKLEDYRDIESINFFTELTEAGIMTPEYMMKCLMLRSRDNARTPMQWNASVQGGFTSGEPWIRINPNYKEINAVQQLGDPDSVFHYYQKLIRLRKEKDIIVYGDFEALCRDDDKIFAYTRKLDQKKLLTVCNFSDQDAEMEIPEEFAGAQCLITNLGRTVFDRNFVLRPYEAFVLYKE